MTSNDRGIQPLCGIPFVRGYRFMLLACLALLLGFQWSPSRAAVVTFTHPAFSVLELVFPTPTVFPGSSSTESPPSGVHTPFSGSAFGGPFVAELFYGNDGCQTADFTGFTAGYIALIARGNCSFKDKGLIAEAAGAAGMIVFDTGINFTGGTICPSVPCAMDLPSIFTTQGVGNALLDAFASGPVMVRMAVVAEVPEPASLLLVGLGCVCLFLTNRRFRVFASALSGRQGRGAVFA